MTLRAGALGHPHAQRVKHGPLPVDLRFVRSESPLLVLAQHGVAE
jgi:hypothetical protein